MTTDNSPTRTVEVVIIEDHPLYRRAIREEFERSGDVVIGGCFGSIAEYDQYVGLGGAPSVAVLDLNLPGMSGAESVAHVCSTGPAVLVLSAIDDPPMVVDAIAAGAAGYLTKSAEGSEIVMAARKIGSGSTYISPTLASYLLMAAFAPEGSEFRRPEGLAPVAPPRSPSPNPAADTLTQRERTILSLVAAGETDQDIARELCISISTVRSHLDRIRHKTGHRRRPDLTRLAYQSGLGPV